MAEGKRAGIIEAPGEVLEQHVDISQLAAEAGEQGQVGVVGHAWFAPALKRDPADEAILPTVPFADLLERSCRLEDARHVRAATLANQRCCSTSPDVGLGANGG
jgi:hypothetical protein